MKLPETFAQGKNTVNAIIETPAGSSGKYTYDPAYGLFKLKKILPAGTAFPFDFGFIPHTMAEDGDPLDIMVLLDFPAFPGCVVECRVIGVLEAEQQEKGTEKIRNDRIVAVAAESINYAGIDSMDDLNETLLNDLIHFFEYYNGMRGKKFRLLRKGDKKAAMALIKKNVAQ